MRATRALSGIAIALSALLLGALSAAAQPASPQSWPQRPVKFILPLGPGSGADIGARLIAEKLAAKWGQPVVVENRPGGDGFVAINAFISARDDHMLLFGPASSFTAHPYPAREAALRSARPRAGRPRQRDAGDAHRAAVARRQVARRSVAMARAQPGKLNWATITGATDLVVAGFLKAQDLDMAKIPYRDPVQALNDVAEGRLHFYWSALAIVRAQMQAGRVKVIAITASEPSAVVPDIPTVDPGGLPGPHLRRSGRPLRHARHAGRAAREDRGRRQAMSWPIPRSSAGCRPPARRWCRAPPPSSPPRSTSSAPGVAETAKVLGIKAATQ